MRTCWHKHKHKHKRKTISQSASTNAYVNDVLTEHKHKHKHKKKAYAYAYVAAVLTSAQASYAYVYAYACVASEDRALDSDFPSPCFDVPKASNFTSSGVQNRETKNRGLGTIVMSQAIHWIVIYPVDSAIHLSKQPGPDKSLSSPLDSAVSLIHCIGIIYQAQVVQKVDNSIHWINHYPMDSSV